LIVKHDKKLDEIGLRKLYQVNANTLDAQVDFIGSNWLLDDATVLKTTVSVMNGGYKWDVFISEGIKDNVERPLWIDEERCVLMMWQYFLCLCVLSVSFFTKQWL
jgi:hypothetical protein